MAQRLVDVARGRQTDVIMVHQPAPRRGGDGDPELAARLVLWGHFHAEVGPTVVTHDDGSWTVGMQQGTAGGVRQPTLHLVQYAVLAAADQRRRLLLLPRLSDRPDHRRAAGALPARGHGGDRGPDRHRRPEPLPVQTRIKLGGGTPTPTPAGTELGGSLSTRPATA